VGHPRWRASGLALSPGRREQNRSNTGPEHHALDTSGLTPTDWLGFAAAALTTSSFVPQALLTLRTRDVSGISLSMYGAFTLGVALWLVYGLALRSWPIVVANALTVALASTILLTKILVERQQRRSPGQKR
jgi:MtN3 and saliva related transmembrane protein